MKIHRDVLPAGLIDISLSNYSPINHHLATVKHNFPIFSPYASNLRNLTLRRHSGGSKTSQNRRSSRYRQQPRIGEENVDEHQTVGK